MKPYLIAALFVLLGTDIVLLLKIKQLKKANSNISYQVNTVLSQKENLENNINKYYSKNNIKVYDHVLQNHLSGKFENNKGLVFRFISNACDPCVEEQIEIINEEYNNLLRAGITIVLLMDDSININKYLQISAGIKEKIVFVDHCVLDEMVDDETSYYFWIDNGEISNILYPVPDNKSITLSYFDFITTGKNDNLLF